MLNHIHTAITRLLHERAGIESDQVDVRFERPTRQWVESLVRPTINFFLFEIAENSELRSGAPQLSRNGQQAQFRVPPRRYDLRYLVAALTTAPEDEHALLWRTLAVLLRHTPIPPELLPGEVAALDIPLAMQVGQPPDSPRALDLWSAFNLPPQPALILTVSAPLDLAIEFSAPLVLTRSLSFSQPDSSATAVPPRIGGIVRTSGGVPIAGAKLAIEGAAEEVATDHNGRFVLRALRAGPLTINVTSPVGTTRTATLEVPSTSYDIVVDEP